MTAIKKTSTIQENKQKASEICPVTYAMEKIGGYWKPIIIYHLSDGCKRYSELKRAIPNITEKMLIQNLKQLEVDNLVLRKAKPVIPPFVTYTLTNAGEGLLPVMNAMAKWAFKNKEDEYNLSKK
ncbi:winged helix-turn-helix transcriptional regulator [Epilithonimonas sp. UC225_85]|uniref:winged helix-turn-helix transcriptional regulator n=1 Tax=Epilithonimonas sp. UC225_85 TaxID=3350167 RepID=UPI0036D36F06